MHSICITCITFDSVMKMEKRIIPNLFRRVQVQIRKIKMLEFINAELESESELKPDTELELK